MGNCLITRRGGSVSEYNIVSIETGGTVEVVKNATYVYCVASLYYSNYVSGLTPTFVNATIISKQSDGYQSWDTSGWYQYQEWGTLKTTSTKLKLTWNVDRVLKSSLALFRIA